MIGVFTYAVVLYLVLGIVFALPFCFRWINRLDAVAGSATLGFRILSIPGAAMLWPVLIYKLRSVR